MRGPSQQGPASAAPLIASLRSALLPGGEKREGAAAAGDPISGSLLSSWPSPRKRGEGDGEAAVTALLPARGEKVPAGG